MKIKFRISIGIILMMMIGIGTTLYGNYSIDCRPFQNIKSKDYDWIVIDTNTGAIMISDTDDKNELASIIDDTVIYPRRFSSLLETDKKHLNIFIYKDNKIKSELDYNIEDNVVYGRYFWLGLNNHKFHDYIQQVLYPSHIHS